MKTAHSITGISKTRRIESDYSVISNKRHLPKRWKTAQIVNARELLELIGLKLP